MKFDVLKPLAWFFLTGSLVLLVVTPAILGISDELLRSSFATVSAVLFASLLLAFFYSRGKTTLLKSPISITLFFMAIMLVLSSVFSISKIQSLFGFGMEVGTLISFAVLLLFYVASRKFFSSLDSVYEFYRVLSITLVIMTPVVLLSIFVDTSKLVFDIFDFSVFSGLVLLISLVYFEFNKNSMYTGVLMAVSSFGVLLSNDRFVLTAIFFSVLIVIFSKLLLSKKSEEKIGIPYASIIVLFFSVIFLFFNVGPIVRHSQLEESRPSLESTRSIVSGVIEDSPIRAMLGTGPNTFAYAWDLHKPYYINDTSEWNVSFRSGSSGVSTMFVTNGLLGGLLFLVLILSVFYVGLSGFLNNYHSEGRQRFYFICTAFVGSLYGLLVHTLAVQSISNLALTFTFLGILTTVTISHDYKYLVLSKLIRVVVLVVAVCIVIISSLFVVIKSYYVISFERDVIAFNEMQDIHEAISAIGCAPVYIGHPTCNRFVAELHRVDLQNMIFNATGVEATSEELTRVSRLMMAEARKAVSSDNVNHNNWIILGNAYAQLALMNVDGGYNSALKSYERASELAPSDPVSFILKAKLVYFIGKDADEALRITENALSVKSDYGPALDFEEELVNKLLP